jgi:gluconolactonase
MPDGLCFDGDGTLYVCGSIGNAIHVYVDGELKESIETGDGTQPTNACVGADGALYVTFGLAGKLVAYDLGLTPGTVHTGSIAGAAS